MKFETRAIHVGEEPNLQPGGSGDVAHPIHLASTFARARVNEPTGGYEYARTGNPTRDALEKRLAALENGQFAVAFASGLAAETSLILALLKAGDHIVAFDDLYGGTRRLFEQIFRPQYQITTSFVDARNPEAVEAAILPTTRLIWMESPTNPLLKLCDIEAIAKIAQNHHIPMVVDNTFASPYFQNPLALGADLVLHSTTKYINGHSDSVGGVIVTDNPEFYEKLKFVQNAAGAILSPFDSFMILRGSKTLAVRMERHQQNAMAIATYLEQHPRVKTVLYPGLPSHPQHELARKQMSGFGGMLSFEVDGTLQQATTFVESLTYFALAESLGGVESLIELPAAMTHASVPAEVRQSIGITDGLIRISVGIENVDDLIEDLEQAFHKTFQ